MRTTLHAAILVMAAAAVAGCDRHPQNATAYNNSGLTAAGGVSNTPAPGPNERAFAPANDPAGVRDSASTSPATSDAASPSMVKPQAMADASAGVTVADEQMSRKILAEIASNSGMKETEVNVTTTNGVVKLAGNARSRDQVTLAMDIARRQPGVAIVESEIKVE